MPKAEYRYRMEDRPMYRDVKDELKMIKSLSVPIWDRLQNELTDEQMKQVILLCQLTGKYWYTKAKGERASDIYLFEGHDDDEEVRKKNRNKIIL